MSVNPYRQVLTGVLIAAIFGALLLGAVVLSLAEADQDPAPGELPIQPQTAFPFQPPAIGGITSTGQPVSQTPAAQTGLP
jgi:hypothetical protein